MYICFSTDTGLYLVALTNYGFDTNLTSSAFNSAEM